MRSDYGFHLQKVIEGHKRRERGCGTLPRMKLSKHHIDLLCTYTAEKGADMMYDEVIPEDCKREWVVRVGGETSGDQLAEQAYERIYEAVEDALTGLEVC